MLFAASYAASEDKKAAKQLKADIESARTALKNATDMEKGDNTAKNKIAALERSEKTMRSYLSRKEYSQRKNLHLLLIDLLRKQYEVGNNKMYLNMQTDTAQYIQTGRRMFLAIEAFDSIDAMPDEKGVVAPSYRKKHSEFLAPYRVNMLNGGLYFISHRQWDEAWKSLDLYLDTYKQPLFENESVDSASVIYGSYLALIAATNMKDLPKARKYVDDAVRYQQQRDKALMMISDLCREKKDSDTYIKYVKEGFGDYPMSPYFFPRLVDYYVSKGDYKTANGYADDALRKDSLNELFLLAKHSIMMATEDYDKALYYGYRILQKNDTLSALNYDMGFIYYMKAQNALKGSKTPYRARMKKAQKYYKQLLPYMERYRKAAPDDRKRWYPMLYDAYLNLNMGKEFNDLGEE